MFEDDYKSKIDRMEPSADALEKTLEAMKNETARAKRKPFGARGILAAGLAAVLLAGTALGAVIIANRTAPLPGSQPERGISPGSQTVRGISPAEGYQAVYERLGIDSNGGTAFDYFGMVTEIDEIAFEDSAEMPAINGKGADSSGRTTGNPGEADYSQTNDQIKGVQEGDIVKNDGTYLYMLSQGKLNIIKAENGKMEKVSSTDVGQAREMIIYGDKLAVISLEYNGDYKNYNTIYDFYYYGSGDYTSCRIYDISDRSAPKKTGEFKQGGYYTTSRCIDGKVYVISSFSCSYRYAYTDRSLDIVPFSTGEPVEGLIPTVDGGFIPAEKIYLPENSDEVEFQGSCYTIVTSFDITDGSGRDSLAILGANSNVYVTRDSVYVATYGYRDTMKLYEKLREAFAEIGVELNSNDYDYFSWFSENPYADYANLVLPYDEYTASVTGIHKISIGGGEMKIVASGTVDGDILNQFSFDERDGFLRVATNMNTISLDKMRRDMMQSKRLSYLWSEYNRLSNKVWVLDKDMNVAGESEEIGLGERIQSVRYIGDYAFVVTFMQTDPLYAIDLSDPYSPKVLSELKITGFSSYMQQYDSGLMLGLGYEATADGATTGVKLTMFDTGDVNDVKAIDSAVFEWGDYGYIDSAASHEHKALLLNSAKKLIAVPMYFYSYNDINGNEWKETACVLLFGFEDGKLSVKDTIDVWSMSEDAKPATYFNYMLLRSNYIDDYVYFTFGNGAVSYSLGQKCVIDRVEFE